MNLPQPCHPEQSEGPASALAFLSVIPVGNLLLAAAFLSVIPEGNLRFARPATTASSRPERRSRAAERPLYSAPSATNSRKHRHNPKETAHA